MKSIRRRQFGYLLEQAVAYVNSLPRDERREALSRQVDELINAAVNQPQPQETSSRRKKR
jgi:hypothetical protein